MTLLILRLLDDVLSIFGLGSSKDDREESGTKVRVERERDDAAEASTESEAAVKGTEESPEHDEAEESEAEAGDEADEPVAAGTDASGSTASITEEPPEDDAAAEPAEAAGPVPDEPEAGGTDLESISGIGSAYASRLNEAGVTSAEELVDADAAELAEETGLSEKRIRGWQENAAE